MMKKNGVSFLSIESSIKIDLCSILKVCFDPGMIGHMSKDHSLEAHAADLGNCLLEGRGVVGSEPRLPDELQCGAYFL